MNASTSNLNLVIEHSGIEKNMTLNFNQETHSVNLVDCTATVTYKGWPVAFFTRSTCEEAVHAACEYITNHGGTCPLSFYFFVYQNVPKR